MRYYSLNGNSPEVDFREAVLRGLAPDKGLYFPVRIPVLPETFFHDFAGHSKEAIAFRVIQPFTGDSLPQEFLCDMVSEVLNFPLPLVRLTDKLATLELFHGPTMAFKDVGARFMARCLGYFSRQSGEEVTVLVATSGDTGSAVADGFKNVAGVRVVILYPKGKVSDIQERQLTTGGENVRAMAVAGTFDDCQAMVKKAFLDKDLNVLGLTSANSINVARWLPQMFYYFLGCQQVWQHKGEFVISVPSGNFGNCCAGLLAQKMGLPIRHFIAATNVNDTVPRYLLDGYYRPAESVPTISNAMDVGDPSNFVRIKALFREVPQLLKQSLSAYSFTDAQTRQAISDLYDEYAYVADPHGAVGYLGLQCYLREHPEAYGIFLETAHPVKFRETVEATLGLHVPLPDRLGRIMNLEKRYEEVSGYEAMKALLLGNRPG